MTFDLLAEFARIGLLSFGGANLAEMERVLVTQRGWLNALTLADGLALGQLMPGPNMLAVTYYGYAAAGLGGALTATLGFYGPTALLSAAVMRLWHRHSEKPWVRSLRLALLPFGAGVMLSSVLVLFRGSVRGWAGALVALVAFILLTRTRLNSALVVLGAAGVGALLGL